MVYMSSPYGPYYLYMSLSTWSGWVSLWSGDNVPIYRKEHDIHLGYGPNCGSISKHTDHLMQLIVIELWHLSPVQAYNSFYAHFIFVIFVIFVIYTCMTPLKAREQDIIKKQDGSTNYSSKTWTSLSLGCMSFKPNISWSLSPREG